MEKNPFRFEVLGEDGPYCNRQAEFDRLERYASAAQNVVLASPRRYGKTSLCRKVQRHLEHKGYLCFEFDFSGVDSISEIARRLARDMLRALHTRESLLSRGKRWLGAFTAFRPVFTFGPNGEPNISVTMANEQDESRTLLEKTLEDLARIITGNKWPCHVVMDEFQELTKLDKAAVVEGLIRKSIQGLPASFVFAGSRRSLLLAMFNDQKRFLTLSAAKEFLPPLPVEETAQCLEKIFSHAGKTANYDVCAEIVRITEGYPFYVQRLSSEVYERGSKMIVKGDVEQARQIVLASEAGLYEVMVSFLTPKQLRLLKTLAAAPATQISGAAFVARSGLPASSIAEIRNILMREDLIEKTENDLWRVVDPFFAAWLRGL